MNRIQVVVTRCTCFQSNSTMEFLLCVNVKKELFYSAAFFILLACKLTSAEEASPDKNSQCHNYAGGHVYPGEAFRVPVSDHSLHLSKAKSESFFHWLAMNVLACWWKTRPFAFCFVLFGAFDLRTKGTICLWIYLTCA